MAATGKRHFPHTTPDTAGDAVYQEITGGAAHMRTTGSPGTLETRWFTIDDATDCITTAATPVAAELLTATFDGTKQRCRVSWHTQHTNAAIGVPDASVVLVKLNSATDGEATTAFAYTDNGAGSTATTDEACRMLSNQNPVIEYNLEGTTSYIDRIDLAGVLPVGTAGTLPVYLFVEVW